MNFELTFQETLLEAAFYTMACDCHIAEEEVLLIKSVSEETNLFGDINVEKTINEKIAQLNEFGDLLINRFLRNIKNVEFSEKESRVLIEMVINMIYSDNEVEYNERRFFRNVKLNLGLEDSVVLEINSKAIELLGGEIFATDFIENSKNKYLSGKNNTKFSKISFD